MISIVEKSFSNTVSIFIYFLILVVFLALLIAWIYLPFAIISMKKEIKRIRELLEEMKKLNLHNK